MAVLCFFFLNTHSFATRSNWFQVQGGRYDMMLQIKPLAGVGRAFFFHFEPFVTLASFPHFQGQDKRTWFSHQYPSRETVTQSHIRMIKRDQLSEDDQLSPDKGQLSLKSLISASLLHLWPSASCDFYLVSPITSCDRSDALRAGKWFVQSAAKKNKGNMNEEGRTRALVGVGERSWKGQRSLCSGGKLLWPLTSPQMLNVNFHFRKSLIWIEGSVWACVCVSAGAADLFPALSAAPSFKSSKGRS